MPTPNDGVIAAYGGASNTGANAPVLTPTFATTVATQLADTTRDYNVYLAVTTSGTATSIAIGPTSAVANTILPSSSVTAGVVYKIMLPAGWFLKFTGTTTVISATAIGC